MTTTKLPEPIVRVEFLRAWEDGHWDTETHNVPHAELVKRSDAGDDDWTLQAWAREHLAVQTQYRRVVLWAVYCIDPEGAEG
jgi:hypothetical protein